MRKNKHWTAEEEDYLAESWGVIKIPTIAEELGRTEIAVISKATEMELGHYYAAQGKLTASALSIEAGVHIITVRAIELLLGKLSNMADTDEEKIALLEQSTANSWLSVYPLKQDKQPQQRGGQANGKRRLSRADDRDWEKILGVG
jgi:hypothetical protein